MPTELIVHRQGFSARPGFDTALSHALLREVSEGRAGESFRLYRPADELAFSASDRRRPGFDSAVRAAALQGFPPLLRLAGGRAAVFSRAGLAFAWTVPAADARTGIRERFESVSSLVAAALRRVGVDARLGEVPGAYCPGDYSVNAGGRAKLMGVGQRVIRGAAHLGGVITVGDGERIRAVLGQVYRELDYPFAARSVGTLEDEVPALTAADVEAALLREWAARRSLREEPIAQTCFDRARGLAARHAVAQVAGSRSSLNP